MSRMMIALAVGLLVCACAEEDRTPSPGPSAASNPSLNFGYSEWNFNGKVTRMRFNTSRSRLLVLGEFTEYGNPAQSVNGFVVIHRDGSLGAITGADFNDQVHDAYEASDGALYVSGAFTTFKGASVGYFVKIVAGNLDATFHANIGSGFNDVAKVIADGRDNDHFAVYGMFTLLNGGTAKRRAKLKWDGTFVW